MNNNEPIPLDLVSIVENIRTQVRSAGNNWVETAEAVGMDTQRLRYFALNPGSVPATKDLTKLIRHYMPGYVLAPASMVVPVEKVA